MDTWGTELYSDDMACDVKEYYMNCLREDMSSDEAEASVVKYFSEELDDRKDGPIVVLALAETAWCTGRLSEGLKKPLSEYWIPRKVRRDGKLMEVNLINNRFYRSSGKS